MSNYFRKRVRSFKYAIIGIKELFDGTPNATIHLVAAIMAIIMGILLKISNLEWVAIIIVIGLVIALEGINSAIEELADLITKEKNDNIRKVKDISAGAVLIASISALATGLFIFGPKILDLIIGK